MNDENGAIITTSGVFVGKQRALRSIAESTVVEMDRLYDAIGEYQKLIQRAQDVTATRYMDMKNFMASYGVDEK